MGNYLDDCFKGLMTITPIAPNTQDVERPITGNPVPEMTDPRFKYGTIIQLSLTEELKDFLRRGLTEFGITGVTDVDKLHQTVFYARQQFDPKIFDVIKMYTHQNISMRGMHLITFKGHDGKTILAIDYDLPPVMANLFNDITSNTTLRHSYPTVKPHITLNYDFNESVLFTDRFIEFSRFLSNGPSWKRDKFGLTELTVNPIIKNFADKQSSNF